jgi:transcriptional regulator of acetoin/glycerol metabolism
VSRERVEALVKSHRSNFDRISVKSIADRAYELGLEEGLNFRPLEGTLAAIERRAIEHAFKLCAGDIAAIGKLLGIGKTTAYRKLREYGMYHGPVCKKCGENLAGEARA